METLSEQKHQNLENCALGKETPYASTYDPSCLYPIHRAAKRQLMGINPDALPFKGFDYWNHYEVSWLNEKGKPIVAFAEIVYDCHSPFIVESKSLKLYFNSFNQFQFKSMAEAAQVIQKDLEAILKTKVTIMLHPLSALASLSVKSAFEGFCLDDLDIDCSVYNVDKTLLHTGNNWISETLYTDLFRSNCLITRQPDWGSLQIAYEGKQINHEDLLRYIVSYRKENEFGEPCVERIFIDILTQCQPKILTVYGRYTRHGGLDINAYRSTEAVDFRGLNFRLPRQ